MDFFSIICFRISEESRRAKSELECSLYNAERKKKPLMITDKVCFNHYLSFFNES